MGRGLQGLRVPNGISSPPRVRRCTPRLNRTISAAKMLCPRGARTSFTSDAVSGRGSRELEGGRAYPLHQQQLISYHDGMQPDTTVVERAFDLAKSGRYQSVDEIKHALRLEGYEHHDIEGPSLVAQLRSLIRASRGPRRGDS